MPSAFTHAVASIALGRAYTTRSVPVRFWILSALCAVAPDVDVLANRFGYDHTTMLGHRGLSHSFLFALVLSGLVVLLFFRRPVEGMMSRLALFAFFFAATASHSVLDAMVDGTLGVAFFAPFSPGRFFLPWRPIVSSPIGLAFFSSAGAATLLNEIVWVWVPSLIIILAQSGVRRAILRFDFGLVRKTILRRTILRRMTKSDAWPANNKGGIT